MLKLKVIRCLTPTWIQNARVDVVIVRPGSGQIDSGTGYTNSSGYVEFNFTNMQAQDEAHVTVTPSGENPDGDHTYHWVIAEDNLMGWWDLSAGGDSLCQDSWFDQVNRIIQVSYH